MFPIKEYFSRHFEIIKLNEMLKSKFNEEIDCILKGAIEELIEHKYLKYRKNQYKLTWNAEIKEKEILLELKEIH
ncbi:hypothetical protein LCGC14_0691920 [marine sediment metagenome]|uniref:Uncharacterized protein n=1 Tax=marine sediment metagenome TaxID=412755 RepID=A0A0F9QQ35_9ZZZZ|nr:hypothetical protein [bacterium]